MLTILWEENGKKEWIQCREAEGDAFIEKLSKNPQIKMSDVTIFFKDALQGACRGNTYNIPVGRMVRIISENIYGRITKREITDVGVLYEYEDMCGRKNAAYENNIELAAELHSEHTPVSAEDLKNPYVKDRIKQFRSALQAGSSADEINMLLDTLMELDEQHRLLSKKALRFANHPELIMQFSNVELKSDFGSVSMDALVDCVVKSLGYDSYDRMKEDGLDLAEFLADMVALAYLS